MQYRHSRLGGRGRFLRAVCDISPRYWGLTLIKEEGSTGCLARILALLALFLAGLFLSPTVSLSQTNRGSDFWIAFPPGMTFPVILMTSEIGASGIVEVPGISYSQGFSMGYIGVTRLELPHAAMIPDSDTDSIGEYGVHIWSSGNVSVHGFADEDMYEGGYLAIPTDSLGKEYMVFTLRNDHYWDEHYLGAPFKGASQFVVVATEDDTTVTIVPSVTTGSRIAGIPYEINLDRGQTYRLANTETSTAYDLSGSEIKADKPVAVYGGRPGNIPFDDTCCADASYSQIPPLYNLGMDYLSMPFAMRSDGSRISVLAVSENTELKINGVSQAVLGKGQVFEKISASPLHIETNYPVLAAQIMQGDDADGTRDALTGDPEIMILTPTNKFTCCHFVTTETVQWDPLWTRTDVGWVHYLNVIAPDWSLPVLSLDSKSLSATSFISIGNSGYSGLQVKVGSGRHLFSGIFAAFGVYVYGSRYWSSYGYSGGMRMSCLNVIPFRKTMTGEIGAQQCLMVQVKDEDGVFQPGVPIELSCSGANSWETALVSSSNGQAEYCFSSQVPGWDHILALYRWGCASAYIDVGWSSPAPGLTLSINAPSAVSADSEFDFTLAVGNGGPTAAYDLVITDTLPASLILISVSGSAEVTGNQLVWRLPTLAVGEVYRMTVRVKGPHSYSDLHITNAGRVVGCTSGDVQQFCSTAYGEATVLVQKAAPSLRVFPNPFGRNSAIRGTVKFEGVVPGTQVRIYTVRGLQVWEGVVQNPYIIEWDGMNDTGKPVAPGTYMWIVEGAEGTARGTLIVE